ncbi:MAG: hypothetical protein QW568_02655 [Candidatus Anstonellaceae archaeon]
MATVGAIITVKESHAAMRILAEHRGQVPRLAIIRMLAFPEHMAELLSKKENVKHLSVEEQIEIAKMLRDTKHWGLISHVVRSSHIETTSIIPVLESEKHLLAEYNQLKKAGKVSQYTPLPKGEIKTVVFKSGIHPDALAILTKASYEFLQEHSKVTLPNTTPSGSPV